MRARMAARALHDPPPFRKKERRKKSEKNKREEKRRESSVRAVEALVSLTLRRATT